MKRLLLLASAITGLCGLFGCGQPGWFTGNEVQEKLERGVSGQGTLGPIDRGGTDPNIPPGNERDTHP
ncbi:MAG: hypothetical protein M3R10_06110 [Verrucomicrobiota bacterium]|nr:hypothetical protein [Verrucomicrobiota bacterium]